MLSFKSKTAVVTRGGGVLYSTIAEALAAKGFKVAIFDLKREAAQSVAHKINKTGGEVNWN